MHDIMHLYAALYNLLHTAFTQVDFLIPDFIGADLFFEINGVCVEVYTEGGESEESFGRFGAVFGIRAGLVFLEYCWDGCADVGWFYEVQRGFQEAFAFVQGLDGRFCA